MENFVVSARKYRPVTFDSVVGQEHITTTLKNAIQTQHLAQAFLFCGPRGVGKTTCARILAKTINCENLSANIEACGTCPSCQSFTDNASFNIHELDAASNNGVDNIRELIDQVRYPPTSGKYKIYIIDEVHMLSTAGFNAFLKTLEEPPAYAIFILATTEKHKILPTILSRCQIFDFNRIKVADMAGHLAKIATNEAVTVEPEALELIAQKADGGLRDALSMFDLLVTYAAGQTLTYKQATDNLHILDYDYYFKITEHLAAGQQVEVFTLLDEILKKGFDGHLFLVGLMEHFRNLLMSKNPATAAILEYSAQVQERYKEQSKEIQMSFLVSALSICSASDISYKASKNQRLHLEIGLLKLANLTHLFSVSTLAEAEKKNPSLISAATVQPVNNAGAMASAPAMTIAAPAIEPVQKVELITLQQSTPTTTETAKKRVLKPTAYVPETKLEPTKKTDSQEINHSTIQDKPILMSDLQLTWDKFLALLKTRNAYTELTWLERPIELAGTQIKLGLDNDLQKTMLFEHTVFEELIAFLRTNLQNSKAYIELFLLDKPIETKLIYTPSQKFEYLNSKNANLLILKQKLGLDYDF